MFRQLRLSVVFVMMACATPALAQENGARISGFFGSAFGEGETNIGTGGAVGYRFTPRVGFDFQAVALPDFEIENGASGRGVAFLTNFVAEFPSSARWLTPYVSGGGGVANISRLASSVDNRDLPGPRRDIFRGYENRIDVRGGSSTDVALTVGGGVDFRIWHSLSVGPNLTYMHLFGGADDLSLTQISGKATYRF